MKIQYILILNDGTDEIYNLNMVVAGTHKGFIDGFMDIFGPFDDFEDLQDQLKYKSYLALTSGPDAKNILRVSNGVNQDDWEEIFLNEKRKQFYDINDLWKKLKTH